jgi:putative endonuclease
MDGGFIYILSNLGRTVLYIGVTSDIVGRIWDHKNEVYDNSFTKRYKVKDLVYFEFFDGIEEAIRREKELKGWSRDKKIRLILRQNLELRDLYDEEFIKSWYQ